MGSNQRSSLLTRFLAIAAAFAVTVSFTPLLSESAFAADDQVFEAESVQDHSNNGSSSEASAFSYESMFDELSEDGRSFSAKDSGRKLSTAADYADANTMSTVNFTTSGLTVTVTGTTNSSSIYFTSLFIDGTSRELSNESYMKNSFTATVDLSSLSVGYHTIYYGVMDFTSGVQGVGMLRYVPRSMTDAPNYNGVFTVYSTYLTYNPFSLTGNTSGTLYLEYSSDGKNWTRSGYMKANMIQLLPSQSYRIGGLKPKKKYRTRICYGEDVVYSTGIGGDGQSYFFSGPYRNTTTIKTGASKKPKIRSVTAKAVNVKYHKNHIPGHYYWSGNVLLYQNAWTEKFYTCKIKVTVRLKKKPGTKGIWVNGRFLKGNKKKYVTTFSPYPNYYTKHPRKQGKFTVTVQSGQSKSYGGYSPAYKKTKRLR